ncbi:MAG: hypothetical protein K9G60_03645 [Pseudolabrys sp.]|nr:hypothetical protein [Pseudolabrys sp.]
MKNSKLALAVDSDVMDRDAAVTAPDAPVQPAAEAASHGEAEPAVA